MALLAYNTPSISEQVDSSNTCTSANAVPMSFKSASQSANEQREVCIRIDGYVYSQALHRTKAVALSNDEPGWQTIGLTGREAGEVEIDERLNQKSPRRAMIVGFLRDCGSKNWPNYCHYVGGPIIRVEQISFRRN
jgi:hypothetical protein